MTTTLLKNLNAVTTSWLLSTSHTNKEDREEKVKQKLGNFQQMCTDVSVILRFLLNIQDKHFNSIF